MESELDLLLGTAIDSLVKLELLLYLQARRGAAQSAREISARLRRREAEVKAALEELAQAGLVERFRLGSGRHVIYGATEDAHVQALLALLHDRYQSDPEARSRIVREMLEGSKEQGSRHRRGSS